MKGVVTIEVRNKDTLELEDTVVRENIITHEMFNALIGDTSLAFNIYITSAVFEPSVYVYSIPYPEFDGMTTTPRSALIPNVPSTQFFTKTENTSAFLQYSARFNPPAAGTTRTTSTVMLSGSAVAPENYSYGYYNTREYLVPRAFAKLAVPCVQTDTQVFDVYYRVFFDYDQNNSDIPYPVYEEFLKRFGLSAVNNHSTGARSAFSYVQYMPWPPVQVPLSEKSTVVIDQAGIVSQNTNYFYVTPTRTEYGWVGNYELGFDSQVGEIISGSYFTNGSYERLIMSKADHTGKFKKIQNLIGNRVELTTNVTPFLNVDNLPNSTGKLSITGDWNNVEPTSDTDLYFETKFPEWNKIQITESGNIGVSKYKYTVQKFIGIQAFESPSNINTYRPLPVPGLCATNTGTLSSGKSVLGDISDTVLGPEQISAIVAFDESSVIYPKKNSIILFSIPASRYWRITGTFTDIHQVAVSNGTIYIACRDTGLWKVNPRSSLVATKVTVEGSRVADFSKCHGVTAGFNGTIWAMGKDALASYNGTSWTIYDSSTAHPFGTDSTIFSNVGYIKADPTAPTHQLLIVNKRTNSTTNLGWWWSTSTVLTVTATQPTMSGIGRPRIHRGHIIPQNGKWMIISNESRVYIADFNGNAFTLSSGRVPDSSEYLQQLKAFAWVKDPDGNSYFMNMPGYETASNYAYDNDYSYARKPIFELIRPDGTVFDTMTQTRVSLAYASGVTGTSTKSLTNNDYVYQGYTPLAHGLMLCTSKLVDGRVLTWVYQYGLEPHPHGGVNRWLATKEYGWDGTEWKLNVAAGRPTHATEEPLFDGVRVKFEEGTTGVSFSSPNYWKFGLCDGLLKDNATRARFRTPHYISKNISAPPVLSSNTVPNELDGATGLVSFNPDKCSNGVSIDENGNIVFPGNNAFQFAVGDKYVTGDFEISIDTQFLSSNLQNTRTAVGVGKISENIHPIVSILPINGGRPSIRARADNGSTYTAYTHPNNSVTSMSIKRVAGTITVSINGLTVFTLPTGIHRLGDRRLDVIFYTVENFSAIPSNCIAPKANIVTNGKDNAVLIGSASLKTDSYDIRFKGIDATVAPTGTLGGVTAPVKTDGTLPAVGEISLDTKMGIMYFNVADVGKAITINCTRVFNS